MRARPLLKFDQEYYSLQESIRKKMDKQLRFLLTDLHHPSLHAKKYGESERIWQARIDKKYRFYFRIEDDTYVLINIKRHSD